MTQPQNVKPEGTLRSRSARSLLAGDAELGWVQGRLSWLGVWWGLPRPQLQAFHPRP